MIRNQHRKLRSLIVLLVLAVAMSVERSPGDGRQQPLTEEQRVEQLEVLRAFVARPARTAREGEEKLTALRALADLLYAEGQSREALAAYASYTHAVRHSAPTTVGFIYGKMGDIAYEIEEKELALSYLSEGEDWLGGAGHFRLGLLREERGDFDRAIISYHLARTSSDIEATLRLARLLALQSREKAAVGVLVAFASQQPDEAREIISRLDSDEDMEVLRELVRRTESWDKLLDPPPPPPDRPDLPVKDGKRPYADRKGVVATPMVRLY